LILQQLIEAQDRRIAELQADHEKRVTQLTRSHEEARRLLQQEFAAALQATQK
jgi:hypothetical protein